MYARGKGPKYRLRLHTQGDQKSLNNRSSFCVIYIIFFQKHNLHEIIFVLLLFYKNLFIIVHFLKIYVKLTLVTKLSFRILKNRSANLKTRQHTDSSSPIQVCLNSRLDDIKILN